MKNLAVAVFFFAYPAISAGAVPFLVQDDDTPVIVLPPLVVPPIMAPQPRCRVEHEVTRDEDGDVTGSTDREVCD